MPDMEQAREESNLLPSVLETAASPLARAQERATMHAVGERQATRNSARCAGLPTPEAHAGIGVFRMPQLIPTWESAGG